MVRGIWATGVGEPSLELEVRGMGKRWRGVKWSWRFWVGQKGEGECGGVGGFVERAGGFGWDKRVKGSVVESRRICGMGEGWREARSRVGG